MMMAVVSDMSRVANPDVKAFTEQLLMLTY